VDRVVSTVAVIPTSAGSHSVPRTHIRPLNGIPLLAYSIEAGRKARLVDRVIVSTDDEEIADVARAWGADVPFLRPTALGVDGASDLPVLEHAIGWLAANTADGLPEVIVQLKATSPLRPPDCVDRAIDLLRRDQSLDSVRGVALAAQNPYNMSRLRADGTLTPLLEAGVPNSYHQPRQALPQTYWPTGQIDVVRTRVIRERASMGGDRIGALIIDAAYACDLDSEGDWRRAEWLLDHLDHPIVRPGSRRPFPTDPRLVVFDFDGVMTDNRVWVGEDGRESVACNRSDGLGLEKLRRLGLGLFVLSTESNPLVAARCRKLDLPLEQNVGDKAERLRCLLRDRGIAAADVVYVGNDVNDADCMRIVGCSVAVADAHSDVRHLADVILTRPGGHGAVRELCDRLAAHLACRRGS
jgi:N-acylneuraminate cytidylyltransferase